MCRAQFDYGGHWVGDLTVNCTLTVDAVSDQGTVVFELCEGLYWYRCRIDVNTGEATLAYVYVPEDPENPNGERVIGTAKTAVQGPGTYRISFANVDNRLCLWVDDGLVDFGPDAAYSRDATTLELPYASDLAPAGIAASGVDAEIRDLVVEPGHLLSRRIRQRPAPREQDLRTGPDRTTEQPGCLATPVHRRRRATRSGRIHHRPR